MPETTKGQIVFNGGVNAMTAPHLLADNEVATATNIDFGMDIGAASVRQGSNRLWQVAATPVVGLFKHYKNSLANSVLYAHSGSAVYRVVSGVPTSVLTGVSTDAAALTQYHTHFYAMGTSGTINMKDDGATVTDWIKPTPTPAPVITISTTTAVPIGTVWWIAEGSAVGSNTQTGTFTATAPSSPFRVQINAIVLANNLSTNGANNIGDWGIDHLKISLSNPTKILRVSRDYSIDDGDFVNYWHTELDLENGFPKEVSADIEDLVEAQLNVGTSTDTSVDIVTRRQMLTEGRTASRNPFSRLNAAANSFMVWAVGRPNFEFIGNANSPGGWSNIGAVRVIIEATAPFSVRVKDWEIRGNEAYPLNDANVGYAWWETFAQIDSNGIKLGEGAPSVSSARTKIQQGRAVVVGGTNPSGTSGCSHRILYRQGGYLLDAYAVATNTIGSSTYTDAMNDMQALSLRQKMNRNVLKATDMPNNVVGASEPHYDRLFIHYENYIAWSNPGLPDQFGGDNYARVSHAGDEVRNLIVWPPGMVIVNRDSVYELDGNIFEGPEANLILRRTGSRHGSKPHKTAIKTPFGIPLVEYDGLYMYIPGQGVDQELNWLMNKIGDAWRGTDTTDPAYVKGNRTPAINKGQLQHSCAEYWNGKYYLAMPTGTNTYPDTIFTVDFANQNVWFYQYPFSISSLAWDFADSRLLAGTPQGWVMQIETGLNDMGTNGTATGVPYSILSKPWSQPTDFVLENLFIDHEGGNALIRARLDGTTTTLIGTATSGVRDWYNPPFTAQVHNNITLAINGTQTASHNKIHQVMFDALLEPKRVEHWRTEHEVYNTEQIWDVHNADLEIIGTGTVTGVVYIDNTAVMTRTDLVGPTSGRNVFVRAFPNETYGQVMYTKYTTTGPSVLFKHWKTYAHCREEPPRVLNYVSTKECGDESEWKVFEPCVAAHGGVVTVITRIDETSISTHTCTGTRRQSHAFSVPNETFGRTAYAIYSSTTPFKFYGEKWEKYPEPDRINNWKHGGVCLPNEHYVKTWSIFLNPHGTMTGTVTLDNTVIATETFTGTEKKWYTVGLDVTTSTAMALQTGSVIEAFYTGTRFKHYDTQFEIEPRPFGKRTWSITYKKVGGASQIDLARFWSYDIECHGTATFTSIWDVDGTATHTTTHTVTNREWIDRLPFPPGIRGRIFQQRLLASGDIEVWKVNLDMMQEGVKGFNRRSWVGSPEGVK